MFSFGSDAVTWSSKKQPTVALSSTEAEYRDAAVAACEVAWLEMLLRDLEIQVMTQKLAGKAGKSNSQQAITGTGGAAKGSDVTGSASVNLVLPDVSKMVVYDPRQASGFVANLGSGAGGPQTSAGQPLLGLQLGGAPGVLQQSKGASQSVVPGLFVPARPRAPAAQFSAFVQPSIEGSTSASVEEAVKVLPPTLGNFLSQLPIVDGPTPNIEMVMAELLQLKIPLDVSEVLGADSDVAFATRTTVGDTRGQIAGNGFTKSGARNISNLNIKAMKPEAQKRKELDRQEDEDNAPVQNRTPDVFRLRQLQRARAAKIGQAGAVGGAGSTSGGSGAITGELSGSSG
ncbi:hypothetical protein L7F22_062219 [Adiantum nelumboides]|nr:hypothetical protein [Adiantum nelumboides]